jgi:hypothetical protein
MGRSQRTWLLVAFAIAIVLRAPSLRYGVISDDEAIYDTMAQEIAAGGVMYRDAVDHKPPGLVYTYAAVESLAHFGPHRMTAVHLFGALVVLATCAGLYLVGRRLLAPNLAVVAPLLYAVTSAAKVPYDGLAVNGELLMNLPSVLAAACALEAARQRGARQLALDALAGGLVATATLYKFQAGLLFVAFAALLAAYPSWRRRALCLSAWTLGFVVPFALFAWYFHRRGALGEALFWGLGFNRSYLREGPPLVWALERLGAQMAGVVVPGALLYAGGLVTLGRLARRTAQGDVVAHRPFLLLWVLCAVGAVGLGERFFGHYFLQAELPLAVAAAGPAARLWERSRRGFTLLLAVPALFFAAGAALPRQPGRWLDSDVPDYASIGAAVAMRSRPTDTIWVWGNAPCIYHSAQRRMGVRFSFCNYLTGMSPATPSEYVRDVDPTAQVVPRAWQLALEDLETRRPELILDTAAAGLKGYAKFPIARYPQFARVLETHYWHDGDAFGVPVYRRIHGAP